MSFSGGGVVAERHPQKRSGDDSLVNRRIPPPDWPIRVRGHFKSINGRNKVKVNHLTMHGQEWNYFQVSPAKCASRTLVLCRLAHSQMTRKISSTLHCPFRHNTPNWCKFHLLSLGRICALHASIYTWFIFFISVTSRVIMRLSNARGKMTMMEKHGRRSSVSPATLFTDQFCGNAKQVSCMKSNRNEELPSFRLASPKCCQR